MNGKHPGKMLLFLLLALCLYAASACADEAENLTSECVFELSANRAQVNSITDGDYRTYWSSDKQWEPYVKIRSETPVRGLYLCFRTMPDSYRILDGEGSLLAEGDTRFHHVFYPLDGATDIEIRVPKGEKKATLGFNEIFVFGGGEIPGWVQRWEEPYEKADILFFSTHPDDELLFMGGAIATGSLADHRNIQVVYFTCSNTTRRSEALNGLWTLGLRHYPEFGPFSDQYPPSGLMKDAYNAAKGKKDGVLSWMTGIIRKYRPEVVVTHAEKGEYGHPQHRMVADSAKACFERAADADVYPESARAFGAWQVKKLYLHLYGDEAEQTRFDFTVPREEFGGLTANELAQKAYEQHVTQAGKGNTFNGKLVPFSVEEYGVKRYPANRFGLYASTVGPDILHDDFMENIPADGEP